MQPIHLQVLIVIQYADKHQLVSLNIQINKLQVDFNVKIRHTRYTT